MRQAVNVLDRLHRAGMRQVDGGSAVVFRVAIGLLGSASAWRFIANGWVRELYVVPDYHFSYLGFGWVRPWPEWGMYLHFVCLGLLGLAVAAGLFYRVSIVLFFLGFTYVELIDRVTYLNHYYWMSLVLLLMVFMPLDRVHSLDARRNPSRSRATVPVWVLWTLRGQIAVVYLFAGMAKLNPDWLLRAMPLRIWLFQHDAAPLIGRWLQVPATAYLASWFGAFYDLTIPVWLSISATRRFAYAFVVLFHLATRLLFPEIGLFPWIMTVAATVFFEPDWPRRLMMRVRRHGPSGRVAALPTVGSDPPLPQGVLGWHRAAVCGLLLFAGVQLVMPLRHHLYPGNVRWTEEGYLFAWRVMLTEKSGHVEFLVTDPASGNRWRVYPDAVLTPLQAERMAIRPELIRQTAGFVAADFARRGIPDVEVRADAHASFNGRPNARLVDPDVDLTAVSVGFGPRVWILAPPPN